MFVQRFYEILAISVMLTLCLFSDTIHQGHSKFTLMHSKIELFVHNDLVPEYYNWQVNREVYGLPAWLCIINKACHGSWSLFMAYIILSIYNAGYYDAKAFSHLIL